MLLRFALAIILVVTTSATPLGTRSVQRSGKHGDVNLAEFSIRATIHGKCSYVDRNGRDVKLIYEETKNVITARSLNPSVVDAVAAVRECRSAAAEVPKTADEVEGRTGVPGYGDSPLEVHARLQEFARASYENQVYANQLQPRILTWLGHGLNNFGGISAPSASTSNFGLSWGNVGDASHSALPGINLVAPSNMNHNTVSYGSSNPFDFLFSNNNANTGAWGVLNSISAANQGGIFGLPTIFSLFNPFSSFNPFSGFG